MEPTRLAHWLLVIPARLKSERLPHKPLQDLGGCPLVQRVFENLKPLEREGARIIVAVDSPEVEAVCVSQHIPCVMTKVSHPSGTDRCLEVWEKFPAKYVMNVQGDEPFMNLEDLRGLARAMEESSAKMGTLGIRQKSTRDFLNPNIVKIVRDVNGKAVYFSRAPVPYDRDAMRHQSGEVQFWQHIGAYAFTGEGLRQFCSLPPSPLESIEKLEQLRAVEAGWSILISEASHAGVGIDTPEDLIRANEIFHSRIKPS